jgi:hypothetical protein
MVVPARQIARIFTLVMGSILVYPRRVMFFYSAGDSG